jgi:hypothetical protein
LFDFNTAVMLYSRVGAGASEPHQNFYPEPEPHKNDADPKTSESYSYLAVLYVDGELDIW